VLPVQVRQQNTSSFSKRSAFHSGELLLAHVVRCVLTLARLNGCEFLGYTAPLDMFLVMLFASKKTKTS